MGKHSGLFSLIWLPLAGLVACTDQTPPLPVITPDVEQGALDKLYGLRPGRAGVTDRSLTLSNNGHRDVAVRAVFGACSQNCPVLVFSHGFGSDNTEYDRLLKHWASHGYTVLAPNHADSGGLVFGILSSIRYGQQGLMDVRVADLKLILNELEDIAVAINQPLNTRRVIAAGHSFGAFSAQQLIGAGSYNPDEGTMTFSPDPRVIAAVALSPPGPMFDQITEESWTNIARPMLIATGTRDSEPRFWPDWQIHKLSFNTSMPGNKFALIVQGADHYLGNLICRTDNKVPPQEHALMMVNAASTAFIGEFFSEQPLAAGGDGTLLLSDHYLSEVSRGFADIEVR